MESLISFLSTPLFGHLLIGGLTTATGLITHFARQIIKNKELTEELYNKISEQARAEEMKFNALTEKVDMHMRHIENQREHNKEIIAEISKLSGIVDVYIKTSMSGD